MIIKSAKSNLQYAGIAGLALTLSLSAGMLPAFAGTIKSSSHIDAVTLFPQGAQITRLAKFELARGDQTLVFNDLPQNILANSIRVEGESDGKLEIGSIDTRRIFLQTSALDEGERKRIIDEIQNLNDQRRTFDNVIQSATTQINMLQNLAGLPALTPRPVSAAQPAATQDWQVILTMIGNIETLLGRVQVAQQQQRSLDKKIRDLTKQLSMHQPRQDGQTEIRVHVTAKAALKGLLRIRYQVRSSGWTPFYDMRLNTGGKNEAPSLQLVRRAAISQYTGESWDNVTLLLSTTRPQASTAAPGLRPQRISFRPPPVEPRKRRMFKKSMAPSRSSDMMMEAAPAPMLMGAAAGAKVKEQETRVRSYGFQATYQIAGRVSVKSGKEGKKVRIATASPEVKLKIRAVPRHDATAYLYANMSWSGKTALLPGRASLYRDGAFVGSGSISLINPGEDKELGFGADDMIKIKRVQLDREKSVTGLISRSRVDVQDYQITVENLHERALPVTILDQIPYSEEKEIKVTLLPKTTKATRKNDDNKRGVLAWDFNLKAGKTQTIRLKYQLEWPKDKTTMIRSR